MISALVVDADPMMCSFITGICENTGSFRVHTAESGEAALVWLFTNDVDVIVSDSRMPHMSGIELLRALREQNIQIPFIFFTDDNSDFLKNEAYQNDAYGFIRRRGTEKKPFLDLMRLMYWAAGYPDQRE
ncbi:response regulator [uncultured Methanoregula sp.]|uniref:response regulator n=1 Tax=uncultured Methanoregula sp. TaxID=1005933 RepID=UPI002AABF7E5|nr:response regulator [uncultured Methanoregula sp.]